MNYFEQARAADPDFAAAYTAIARVKTAQAEYYVSEPRSLLTAARESASLGLARDRTDSDAHLALGNICRMLDWDWEGAASAYREALALNPSSEAAHRHYAQLLASQGSLAEAVRAAERARELDPLCLVVGTNAAWVQYLAGDFDAAVTACGHVLDMDRRHRHACLVLGASLARAGRPDEGLAQLEATLAFAPADPVTLCWLAHAKGARGDRPAALVLLHELHRLSSERYVPAYHLALVHAGLTDPEGTLVLLNQACEERDPALLHLSLDPRFEPLRDDPSSLSHPPAAPPRAARTRPTARADRLASIAA